MDATSALPDEVRFAIGQMAKLSPPEVARKRADFFMYWTQWAKDLKVKE